MTKLERIERDISSLSAEELARFREWFASFDADAWDRQIESDGAAGKLDELIAEARKEAGRVQPILNRGSLALSFSRAFRAGEGARRADEGRRA